MKPLSSDSHSRLAFLKTTGLLPAFAALGLVAFGVFTGEPVCFLKWFFGFQADD